MDESRAGATADALIHLLRSSITGDGAQAFGHIVLYTSFGVVRGRTGLAFAQELTNQGNGGAVLASTSHGVIELNDVTVEHYSNHLPTAAFDRLYVRLSDVQGFALDRSQGQG
jgi:hypothetical protein